MKSRQYQWLLLTGLLSFAVAGSTSFAIGRGGGGGGRGGGGGMARGGGGARPGGGGGGRSAYSGGSVRYSSPSRSASAAPGRSGGSYSGAQRSAVAQRPGAGGGGVQRVAPSGGSYSGRATPSYGAGATARTATPSYGAAGRTATPSYGAGARAGTYGYAAPSAGGGSLTGRSVSQARGSYYTPPATGSMIHTGSYTTQGGSTIYGAKGPGSGGAVGVKGVEGSTAGAIRGPGGNASASGFQTTGGVTGRAVQGPGGAGAAGIKGPEGGVAGAVRGPGGAAAAGVRGPEGGTAGAVRGPAGGGAAGVRGPEGAAAGAAWGPAGRGVAGVSGPYGNRVVTNLPAGAVQYPWRGSTYWHAGYGWYQPCWVGDSMYYGWAYPPIGFYYSELPSGYTSVTVNGTPYYQADGVYYQEGEQNGQKGYVVAEAPVTPETTEQAAETAGTATVEGLNPFDVLKSMSDYVGGLQKFSAVAQTTSDEVQDGAKVQISAQRTLYVSRPNQVAMDVTGDRGTKRFVYNGQTASLYDGSKNTAMTAKMPDTIEAALDTLAKEYGAVLPLGDLVYKDLFDRVVPRLTQGQYLGQDTVNGVNCHHLAFTSNDADWEIWIDAGAKPTPRKIAIDYRAGAARTRYSAEITQWTESPALAATVFEFKPPAGTMEVEISKKG